MACLSSHPESSTQRSSISEGNLKKPLPHLRSWMPGQSHTLHYSHKVDRRQKIKYPGFGPKYFAVNIDWEMLRLSYRTKPLI